MGKIQKLLKGKLKNKRARIKAQELSKLSVPITFNRGNRQITVKTLSYVDGTLVVDLDLYINGVKKELNTPYIYVNPPISVPDGTTETAVNFLGETYQKRKFVENPLAAVRDMVIDTIKQDLK